MAERQSKRLQPSIRGRPKGPRATCINLDHDSERRWKWKRNNLRETTELRKPSNLTANAFVTVTYSYEMECEVLRSFFPTHNNNGLNPAAAGFWRFFFIDS